MTNNNNNLRRGRRPLPNQAPQAKVMDESVIDAAMIAADLASEISSAVVRNPLLPQVSKVQIHQAEERALVRREPSPAKVVGKVAAKAPAKQEVVERAYIAVSECDVEEVEPLKTNFFDTINKVKALTAHNQKLTVRPGKSNLAAARGYAREDLYAIAEVAYHYLFSGGTKLALALYEGLNAVKPDEPYFALALGLTHDHLGDKPMAFEWYKRARELDPGDARPEINIAELLLEDGDFRRAKSILARAAAKAKNRGDAALERKASSILAHIENAA